MTSVSTTYSAPMLSAGRDLFPFSEAESARPFPEEDDEELPVLRTRRRVPVKRGRLPKGRLGRVLVVSGLMGVFALMIAMLVGIHSFFMTDARFRIDSASSIQVLGNSQVTRPELLSVFGSDIGRNIFHVPLAVRRTELEELPWVEHATVMRLLPNQLRISVTERVPVAFVRAANQIGLVDRSGVLLDMPPAMMAAKRYSFPVVTGISTQQSADDRASRMRLYTGFMNVLKSTGTTAATQISEVDLSDPEDVRVLLPSAGSDLLVHFGNEDFAARWQRLEQKLPAWRQQYPRLAGVDLRYQRQTVLEMSRATDQGTAPVNTDPTSTQSPATLTSKTAAKPLTRTHSAIQRGKPVSAHKTLPKFKAVQKPAHRAMTYRERP